MTIIVYLIQDHADGLPTQYGQRMDFKKESHRRGSGSGTMSIGQPQGMLLNQFGMLLWDAFGEVAYHVGSSLTTEKTTHWRDVDVRLMLDDEVWEKMGLGDPANPHTNKRWRAFAVAFSRYGQHLTGLPIDFQLQQRTHANAKFTTENGCRRSALIVVDA